MILSYFLEQNFVIMLNLNLITPVLVLIVDFTIQVEQNELCVQREMITKILAISVQTCRYAVIDERQEDIDQLWQDIEDTKSDLEDYCSHLERQVFENRYEEEEIKNLPDDAVRITSDWKHKILECYLPQREHGEVLWNKGLA